MAKVPTQQGKRTDLEHMDSAVHKSKQQFIEDAGFTVKQVQRFETLAAHPEAFLFLWYYHNYYHN